MLTRKTRLHTDLGERELRQDVLLHKPWRNAMSLDFGNKARTRPTHQSNCPQGQRPTPCGMGALPSRPVHDRTEDYVESARSRKRALLICYTEQR